ncbi:hypothetical protein HWV62_35979 [Athelia sp. TMB]|nr:hypothetical protein HWV62_35979 [Athelia sp. TMB]
MAELASALPYKGAPYSYLLNVSSKSLSIIGAALLLLDFTATTVVSAATTASYISGEVTLPFPAFVIAIFYLVLVGVIPLSGAKGSSRIAIGMLMLHLTTMAVLAVAGFIAWGRTGSSQLRENWVAGQAPSATAIIHEVFNGVCLGMLGLTGFEDVPAYISHIKPGRFPLVLRNLHIPAIVINTVIMLLTLAILPLDIVVSSPNVLSVLGQYVSLHFPLSSPAD